MFIDFHTHRDRQSPDLINVQTLDVKANLQELPNICSLGLHPWFVQPDSWHQSWETLERLANSPQVIAIGECGLDRGIDLPMEVQITIFGKHIELAESLQKPLVIHCVRAFSELISLKKRSKSTIPWVIHGFNKKLEVFYQLLDQDFYFSFGEAILSDHGPMVEAIATIPEGRFLLETDDHPDLKIEQIYERAASLRQVPVAILQTQLVKTYEQLTRLF
ncbi:hydrolase TatD [Pseudanabaena biceps]|nr:hydrolase TatD [Pseudanabaena biceps]